MTALVSNYAMLQPEITGGLAENSPEKAVGNKQNESKTTFKQALQR